MSEVYSLSPEQESDPELARAEEAFRATRELFRNKKSLEPMRNGLEQYFGSNERKVTNEMKGIEEFTRPDTTRDIFLTERGLPYVVWNMITAQMKDTPDLKGAQFEDEEYLNKYLEELAKNVYTAYSRLGAEATY